MAYSFDTSELPLVTMTMDGQLERDDWDRFFDDLGGLLDHHQEFALVLEAIAVRTPEFAALRRLGEWFAVHDQQLRRWHRGCAIVTTSAMVRGSIKAFRHLHIVPMPLEIVDTPEQAQHWARQRLASPPPLPIH